MSTVNSTKGRLSVTASILMALAILPGSAAIFSFVPIEFQDATLPGDLPNDPALSPIEVALQISESGGSVYFLILNTSDTSAPNVDGRQPTVTSIYIEDPNDILAGGHSGSFDPLGSIGTVAGEGVDYQDSSSGGVLQGKNNVSPSFDATFSFDPKPAPAKNGIDPGEIGSFEVGTAPAALVEGALVSGDIRVGLHVQQIGEGGVSSAGYMLTAVDPPIPEPGTLCLSLLGSMLLLVRRRA